MIYLVVLGRAVEISLTSWSVILMKELIDEFLPCDVCMVSKQKVIAQALGIAHGTVSKVLKRKRETGVICYVRAEMGVPRQQTPFMLSGYGSLIPLYPEC